MYTQKYKAFTLVELMIVIAIIGILVLAAMSLVNSQNTKQQRAIRFAELIEDTITRAKQDMVIGRGSWSGTTDKKIMIPNIQQTVIISSGSIISKYKPQGSDIKKIGKKLESPFLEGDQEYRITTIQTSSGRITTNDTLSPGKLWKNNNTLTLDFGIDGDIEISGDKGGESMSFMITLEYEVFKRYIVGDKVSGIITTYRKPIKPKNP